MVRLMYVLVGIFFLLMLHISIPSMSSSAENFPGSQSVNNTWISSIRDSSWEQGRLMRKLLLSRKFEKAMVIARRGNLLRDRSLRGTRVSKPPSPSRSSSRIFAHRENIHRHYITI
ncbi:hypothetical protein E1A91_D12G167700v1 [Gossypium mustelinum]|uniref:Uncharacterized protein n=1 Tax=Gossypium mustelinum TaxID=34275 RepID=A0A5D2SEM4_GOSMU|nr:hypothetical protein E1A91_D12G167700v1 [Gossypium mustelinum]